MVDRMARKVQYGERDKFVPFEDKMITSADIEREYFSIFTPEFNGDLLRLIAEQCKNSTVECFTFYPPEEGADLLGGMRRAKVESKARALAEAFPKVKARPVSSRKSGRGNYHTEITCGDGVLTIHKVQFAKTKVRKAIHRDSYARKTDYGLFGVPQQKPPVERPILYGQLKYGVDRRLPQALAFALIDFPDENGEIVHTVDLLAMERYASIPSEFVNLSTVEDVEENLNLTLRPDAKSKARKDEASDDSAGQ